MKHVALVRLVAAVLAAAFWSCDGKEETAARGDGGATEDGGDAGADCDPCETPDAGCEPKYVCTTDYGAGCCGDAMGPTVCQGGKSVCAEGQIEITKCTRGHEECFPRYVSL
ncbi:MAG: hypothetical protein HY897_18560 [Deltaproteobacteria bacterium]|nr:hypothetical protein [Deltaproteobacteria bacterium]